MQVTDDEKAFKILKKTCVHRALIIILTVNYLEHVVNVIVYANTEGGETRKNRGFCFVDFNDHKAASDAKRWISMGKVIY